MTAGLAGAHLSGGGAPVQKHTPGAPPAGQSARGGAQRTMVTTSTWVWVSEEEEGKKKESFLEEEVRTQGGAARVHPGADGKSFRTPTASDRLPSSGREDI